MLSPIPRHPEMMQTCFFSNAELISSLKGRVFYLQSGARLSHPHFFRMWGKQARSCLLRAVLGQWDGESIQWLCQENQAADPPWGAQWRATARPFGSASLPPLGLESEALLCWIRLLCWIFVSVHYPDTALCLISWRLVQQGRSCALSAGHAQGCQALPGYLHFHGPAIAEHIQG